MRKALIPTLNMLETLERTLLNHEDADVRAVAADLGLVVESIDYLINQPEPISPSARALVRNALDKISPSSEWRLV